MNQREITIITITGAVILAAIASWVWFPPPSETSEPILLPKTVPFPFRSTEYDITVTMLNQNATHYSIAFSVDMIYLELGYYDIKPIPESRDIYISRGSNHHVTIYYWQAQHGDIYKLVFAGVYG